ncbi:hypothetical protein BYT27DRAFT_7181735 [Phlegmacium glaucopus]|nr:hypothetical protein BYT27DRAFT_7181735 [Phlegmacium glaucopus]
MRDRRLCYSLTVGHTFCGGAKASLETAKKTGSGPTNPRLPATTHAFNRHLLEKNPRFPKNHADLHYGTECQEASRQTVRPNGHQGHMEW